LFFGLFNLASAVTRNLYTVGVSKVACLKKLMLCGRGGKGAQVVRVFNASNTSVECPISTSSIWILM